ncbi:MAG: hypothetical protein QXR19_12295 [Candidatus Jordarchaeaceae archaeon]
MSYSTKMFQNKQHLGHICMTVNDASYRLSRLVAHNISVFIVTLKYYTLKFKKRKRS